MADALKQKLTRLEGEVFGRYLEKIARNRAFYELEFGTSIVPPAWRKSLEPFIPETAARAIDEPANHILDFPHIKVPVRASEDDSESEKVIAAVKRVFINSWWGNIIRMANPIGDGKRAYLNEGRLCLKVEVNWDAIPDKPQREDFGSDSEYRSAREKYRRDTARIGEIDFPWKVEILDNATVFEDPSNHRDPEYLFCKYNVLCEEARRRWPDASGSWKDRDDFQTVEYAEYWTKPTLNPDGSVRESGRYVQWVDDETVYDGEHPYLMIPIFIEDNGLGVINSLAKPHQKYRGISEKAQQTFIAQARQLTAWQAVNELSAFPMGLLRNSSKENFQVGPGLITPVEGAKGDKDGEDLEWLRHPDVPQGVLALFQTTQALADSTFKLNALGGIPQKGVDTATEADQNVRNASAILAAPVAGLGRLVERISRFVFITVEKNIEAPVTVRGAGEGDPAEIKLYPSDIKGFYEVRAELRTSDEESIAINKARFWIEMALRAPFLSYETAMVKGEITDDPVTERLRRAAEDVFLSDAFKAIRVQTGAQSFGQFAQIAQEGAGETPGLNQRNSITNFLPSGERQNDIFAESLMNRDTMQGGASLRG